MRGQAHTVEAFVAAVLIVGGLVFATQATAVTPLSASTSNQHIENQQEATVEGLLATAEREGTLHKAVLHWDPDEEEFHDVPDQGTYAAGPPNGFGDALDGTFSTRQVAFNVDVHYARPGGGTGTEPMVRMGEPSDNAVAASRTIGLYDSSELTESSETLYDTDGFYADDIDDESELYTVVEVEVVVWRK